MKKSLVITFAAAAVILVLAFAVLTLLSALAGQESGLEGSTGWHRANVAAGHGAPR